MSHSQILVSLLSILISKCSSQSVKYSPWTTGVAAQMSGQESSCGYGNLGNDGSTFPYTLFAGISSHQYKDSLMCGACFEIGCTENGTSVTCCKSDYVTILVSNKCDDNDCRADSNRFELSQAAFTTIADYSNPACVEVSMNYRRVSCDIESNIEIINKDGIGGGNYGMWIKDVAGIGTISKVEIRDSGTVADTLGWVNLIRDPNDNFWRYVLSGDNWTPPFDVRITNTRNETLNASNIVDDMTAQKIFDFGKNFEVST